MFIKVCGMTTSEAVRAALEAHVDAIGFVFAESKRKVTPAQAVELLKPARGRVHAFAVTKHPTQAEVDDIIATFEPDVLQTDWEDLQTLRLPSELAVIPVVRAGRAGPTPMPTRVLFEGPVSGTGITSDWNSARDVARRVEVILAGGLSPANVADAIDQVQPFGVDVSSGVEQSPGVKSPIKIASFVEAARAAFARSQSAPVRVKEKIS